LGDHNFFVTLLGRHGSCSLLSGLFIPHLTQIILCKTIITDLGPLRLSRPDPNTLTMQSKTERVKYQRSSLNEQLVLLQASPMLGESFWQDSVFVGLHSLLWY